MADSDFPRKAQISGQIDTLLASNKAQKIAPSDHRTVATSIVNYIDNRILTMGSVSLTNWANRYNAWYITFSAPVSTAVYLVLGSPSTSVGSQGMSSTFMTIRSRSTTGFILQGFSPSNIQGVSVSYDYIVIGKEIYYK